MQWSAADNAGFSTAAPERLYCPVIADPVYAYRAVNVEAQQHDAAALLHWMRNLVGLRKLFHVFGRGSIEFLNPDNRKVVAHVRRDQQDQILCVANLSRSAQPVALDLSAFAGATPIEMQGYTAFPEIGDTPERTDNRRRWLLLVRAPASRRLTRQRRPSTWRWASPPTIMPPRSVTWCATPAPRWSVSATLSGGS